MRLQLTQAWIDTIKIHDVNDPTCVYGLRSSNRKLTSRRVEVDRAQRDGILDLSNYFGAQVIDLAGYVDAGTFAETEDAYDLLRAQLALPGSHTFKFRRLGRGEDEQATVKLGDGPYAPQEGYGRTIKYSVTLVGSDPRIYTVAQKSGEYDPTGSVSGGGMAMPMVFPLVFTTTTVTELTLTNNGTRSTPPIFTVHGPVASGFALDNDTTGRSIYFTANLGSADVLVVDVDKRSVKLNGAERKDLYDSAQSTWWELAPGDNAVRLRGSGMATGVTDLTVQFHDARI